MATGLEQRTLSLQRLERLARTVPQPYPVEPAKTCCTKSAITGNQVTGYSQKGFQECKLEVLMKLYIGIDWSVNKHDIVFMNERGGVIERKTISHEEKGFWEIKKTSEQLEMKRQNCIIGIETEKNLLVEWLWGQGYESIYIIPPKMTKSLRGRHRSSRARTDQSDAELLADMVRTDRARLRKWRPNSVLTRRISVKVNMVQFQTKNIVRISNRLWAILSVYYPAALAVFSNIKTQIALEFILTYPTPIEAQRLSYQEFSEFCRKHRYSIRSRITKSYARLQERHAPVPSEAIVIYQEEALYLSELLLQYIRAKIRTIKELQELFLQHPDANIFSSLPGAGALLAPSLLAQFGDDRMRFPNAKSVQMIAGTCPVTIASGKRKVVRYRQACDRQFRAVAIQWAKGSIISSPWANAYFTKVYRRGKTASHAYRCLANRWLAILWKLWQTGEEYDEAYHLQQRNLHMRMN